jgi:hypothetical protein
MTVFGRPPGEIMAAKPLAGAMTGAEAPLGAAPEAALAADDGSRPGYEQPATSNNRNTVVRPAHVML